jgi:hypothetical protein
VGQGAKRAATLVEPAEALAEAVSKPPVALVEPAEALAEAVSKPPAALAESQPKVTRFRHGSQARRLNPLASLAPLGSLR